MASRSRRRSDQPAMVLRAARTVNRCSRPMQSCSQLIPTLRRLLRRGAMKPSSASHWVVDPSAGSGVMSRFDRPKRLSRSTRRCEAAEPQCRTALRFALFSQANIRLHHVDVQIGGHPTDDHDKSGRRQHPQPARNRDNSTFVHVSSLAPRFHCGGRYESSLEARLSLIQPLLRRRPRCNHETVFRRQQR